MSKPSSKTSKEELTEFIQLYMREVPNLHIKAISEEACEKVRHLIMQSYRPSNDPDALSRREYENDLSSMLHELKKEIEETLKERVNEFVFDRRR